MTASSTTGSPFRNWKVGGLTELSWAAYSAPPSPAMPALRVNTWSLVVARFTPRVTQAASLDFMARRRRPNGRLRIQTSSVATSPNTTPMSTRWARSPSNETGPTSSRPTARLPLGITAFWLKTRLSIITANAAVASAR